MRQEESNIQISCVKWFRLQHPDKLLIAIPNGGNRNRITGAILKAEGVTAGAPDLFLFESRLNCHGLAIEMKTSKGKQSPSQRNFQKVIEKAGYKYVVARSFVEFKNEVELYLNGFSYVNSSKIDYRVG